MKEKIKKKLIEYKPYIALSVIGLVLLVAAYEYYHRYIYIFRDPDKIRYIITSYGKYGVSVFLLIQILQVIAFFIPGEIVQMSGGYIYGTVFGSILSIIGITVGSIICYGISQIYGKPLVNKMISKRHLKFFDKILRLGSINSVVFLLYLIPGIPKDVLAYICGISDINLHNVFYIGETAWNSYFHIFWIKNIFGEQDRTYSHSASHDFFVCCRCTQRGEDNIQNGKRRFSIWK